MQWCLHLHDSHKWKLIKSYALSEDERSYLLQVNFSEYNVDFCCHSQILEFCLTLKEYTSILQLILLSGRKHTNTYLVFSLLIYRSSFLQASVFLKLINISLR